LFTFDLLLLHRPVAISLHSHRVVQLIELRESSRVRLAVTVQARATIAAIRRILRILLALAHVLVKRGRHRERHAAVLAVAGLLADPTVRLHVTRQLRALRTGVAAQLALVRLLARVRAPVHCQVRAVLEHLAAEFARVRALFALQFCGCEWAVGGAK